LLLRKLKLSRGALALLLAGALLSLTAASAAATTYSVSWHTAFRKNSTSDPFTAVSCPNKSLCVAVDTNGEVVWSRSPTRLAKYWGKARVDKTSGGLTGISCPSSKLCVAVDAGGNMIYSKNPSGGARKWSKPVKIDTALQSGGGSVGFAGISCASTGLCVAVDNSQNGGLLVSTNPTAGATAWRRTTIAHGQELTSVSCTTNSFCVAVGTERFYSTNVRGWARYWHQDGVAPGHGVLAALDCPLTTLCVGVGYDNSTTGEASASVKPAGGAWVNRGIQSRPPAPTEGLADGVACPNSKFCVAVDSADNAYTTQTPATGGWSAPKAVRPGATSTGSAISCNASICVVADNRGLITSGSVK
jgi:hypothetical protein